MQKLGQCEPTCDQDAELDEVLGLSDRIAVLYDGELMDVLDAEDSNREKIGLLMAGITDSKSSA